MMSWSSICSIVHLVGLALGLGCATLKLALLLQCTADHAFIPTYLRVARPITRLIILGMVLLTLSGIVWLLLGYPFTFRLGVKLVLVAALWVLGPIIDNVVEPRFRRLAPEVAGAPQPAFLRSMRQYVAWEVVATLLFYVIVVLWQLR
jgi:hypothetical protein